MQEDLIQYYTQVITPNITTPKNYQRFTEKLNHGSLTRAENPKSHLCAMTLAHDPTTKKVLVVNHKKAGSWIFPGGHIEQEELPTIAAIREAGEEIGLQLSEEDLLGPFGAQVLDIDKPLQACKEHYDIFFGLATDPLTVTVNMEEFLGYEWLDIERANERIETQYYKDALDRFVRFMDW